MSFARDILSALVHIHAQRVIHADLKVENILAFEPATKEEFPVLKVCDFGLSQRLDPHGKVALAKKIGTIGYMAPELGVADQVDTAIDMWSFGIVLYEMAAGYKPSAVKGFNFKQPIPFPAVDWRRRSKALQNLIC
jgi:serine/threonine protein kinase